MTPGSDASSIDSVLVETRVFPPPEAFSRMAHIQSQEQYQALWNRARDDPDGFWSEQASRVLDWARPWDRVLDWDMPWARWFVGGQLNASYNCVDRHCIGPRKDKTAIVWEGEPGDRRILRYQDLHREVTRFAQVLKGLGIQKGDMVTLYMPMVPETIIAMLACARIGAPHMVVFAGYSGESLAERIRDCQAKVLVTADGGYRRGKIVPLKEQADVAASRCPSIQHLVVYRRTGHDVTMQPGRDLWWHDLMASAADADCPPEPVDSEHPLFVLYTSGSTGKPKGSLHTTGGYLLGTALTTEWVFDLKEDDVFWCTADLGWITGHSYTVYGPLALGATVVMYEGAPNYPDEGRFWKLVEDYRVTILYTSPTAIRAFVRSGERFPKRHDLSSLRLLGTVGEPINPEAWLWYYEVIGNSRCPIVDTWWQTETGAIMISSLPGATPGRPGSVSQPLPGVFPMVVDRDGHQVPPGQGGYLVITKPWPSMLRTVYRDDEQYNLQYWKVIPGVYYTGDGARCDSEGNYWILGRVDDVINVSGHRLSTMELENAVASHPAVAEAAVVGRPDERRGQAITAFVTLQRGFFSSDQLRQELREHVVKAIGALARPDDIRFADALPRTRSGKVMRRLLRDIATGHEATGDITTLEDLHVLFQLRGDEERTDR